MRLCKQFEVGSIKIISDIRNHNLVRLMLGNSNLNDLHLLVRFLVI